MKFLKALSQKKLAKAVVCGLVVSGSMFVGMGQVFAETYISCAGEMSSLGDKYLYGTAETEVKIVFAEESPGSSYQKLNDSYICGVFSENGDVTDGKVTIEGGTISKIVRGGNSLGGNTARNIVTINGGTVKSVYGANAQTNSNNNTVTVSGGEIKGSVYGGYALSGEAKGNIVNISGGTVDPLLDPLGTKGNKAVYGGCSWKGTAEGNIVNISGGTINIPVIAGGGKDAEAKNNTVNLIGIDGQLKVTEGYTKDGSAIENPVEHKGIEAINIGDGVYGSGEITYNRTTENYECTPAKTSSGNTLNVAGIGTNVGNIAGFDAINFYVAKDMIGKSMLIVDNARNANTVLPVASEIKIIAVDEVTLKEKDTITLINKLDTGKLSIGGKVIEEEGKVEGIDAKVIKSAVEDYVAEVKVGGEDVNDLILTLGKANNPDNDEVKANIAKNMVETRAAGLAIVNEGVDFMVEHGMANAKAAVKEAAAAGDKGVTPFAAIGGGKMRYNSGSHIDSKSWHGAVGIAKEIGNMTIGFAVDHGKTSFDSYNDCGVTGSGDSKATGASVMVEVKKDSGVHYDGSIRAGRVKNDYSALTSYDQSSTYYGLSLGGGKEFQVSDKNVVDVYGRYFWTHTNSADTTDNIGTKLEFDAINSHRVRVGGRFTHDVNDISKLYAGLAWQHEFKGDTRATVGGFEAPAPSLKGNTGIMELGWKVSANKNLDLDLGATGYTGKQKGASLNLAVNFKF